MFNTPAVLTKIRSYWRRMAGVRVVSPEEIEGALKLPVLAIIPHLERRRKTSQTPQKRRSIEMDGRWFSRLLIHYPEGNLAISAYRAILTELQRGQIKEGRRAILVTSPVAGEGTTLTCINLAIMAARQSLRVVIIETCARSSRISRVLKYTEAPGLAAALAKSQNLDHVIHHASVGEFDVIPCGALPAKSAELWASTAFNRLLTEARQRYDLVFVEGAPLHLFPDSPIIAEKVDGVLLVHQFGRSSAERVQKAVEKLGAFRHRIIGIALNDMPVDQPE